MVYERWKFKAIVTVSDPSSLSTALGSVTVPCYPGMAQDFKDVRFSANGVALPYWIEEYTAGSSAKFWVKLPANLVRIYMHYGQGTAASESSLTGLGALFADNLESGSVSNWDIQNGTMGGTAGIRTDKKFGSYSVGTDQAGGQGQSSSTYDQCHAFVKVALSSVAVGSTVSFYCKARRWYNTSGAGTFVGIGLGSNAEIVDLDNGDTWREILLVITRTATSTWSALAYSNGSYIGSATRSRTFSSYFLCGLQTRGDLSFDISMYARLDNALLWTGTAPTLTLGPHFQAGSSPAGALSIESADVGLGVHVDSSFKDTPQSANAGLGLTAAAQVREVTAGAVNLGIHVTAEAHDTQIKVNAGLGITAGVDNLKYYIGVNAGLGLTPAVSRKDFFTGAAALGIGATVSDRKLETIEDYNVGPVEVSRTITDTVWQLTTEFTGEQLPPLFFPIQHQKADYTGTMRHLFTGISPKMDVELGSVELKTKMTAYDYAWYLNAQYVPDDSRTLQVSTTYWPWTPFATWQACINHLLENTGITAYRIRTGPATYLKQFIFSNTTTKRAAIEEISEYCGYIFEVKWRDYGTTDNPDWRPVAYWVPEGEIDDSDDGLDIPAPLVLSWPDPYLVDLPAVETAPEERVNRVRIIGSDSDGNVYSSTVQTAAVTAGTELPREYMEESSNLTTQSQVNAYATSMLNYFARPAVTVTLKFIDRFDIELYQKIQFDSTFPAPLRGLTDGTDGIYYLRVTGIKYHTEPANNYVEVTAVYDHPIIIVKNRQHILKPNWVTEMEDTVTQKLDRQMKAVVGTVYSIAGDGKSAILTTEFGSKIKVRIK